VVPWPTALLSLALSCAATSRSTWELLRTTRISLAYATARELFQRSLDALEPHLVHNSTECFVYGGDNCDLYERYFHDRDGQRGELHNTTVTIALAVPSDLWCAAEADVLHAGGSIYRSASACPAVELVHRLLNAEVPSESAAAKVVRSVLGKASADTVVAHALELMRNVRTSVTSAQPLSNEHRFGYFTQPGGNAPLVAHASMLQVMTDAKVSSKVGIELFKQRHQQRSRRGGHTFDIFFGDCQLTLNLLRNLDEQPDPTVAVGIGFWHFMWRVMLGASGSAFLHQLKVLVHSVLPFRVSMCVQPSTRLTRTCCLS
jgi:hypothetical protein